MLEMPGGQLLPRSSAPWLENTASVSRCRTLANSAQTEQVLLTLGPLFWRCGRQVFAVRKRRQIDQWSCAAEEAKRCRPLCTPGYSMTNMALDP
jgi:hypothetical protein